MSRKNAITAAFNKGFPSSPLVHTLRSGRSFSANKHSQDIRKFLSPLPSSSRTTTTTPITSEASSSNSCTIVVEDELSTAPPVPDSTLQQKRSTTTTTHLEVEGIEISEDSNDDVVFVGVTSSPPKVAKPTLQEEKAKSSVIHQPVVTKKKSKPPFIAVKAESATPTKSNADKAVKKGRSRMTIIPALTMATRSRSRLASDSAESSGRSSSTLLVAKSTTPPVQVAVARSPPKMAKITKDEPLPAEPVVPPETKHSPIVLKITLPRTASSENLPSAPVTTVEEAEVKQPRKLKRLHRRLKKAAKKLSNKQKAMTRFEYLKSYSTSKFTLRRKTMPPIAEILKHFTSKKRQQKGTSVKSLFELALTKLFRETLVRSWPKSPALFSNKVVTEILPKMVQLSPLIRKKPSLITELLELLVLIGADHRANVHLLKEITNVLSKLVGIRHNPTIHALVDRKLSRQLPSWLRIFRLDWQAVLRLARCIFFKDKLAFGQTACFLLFDRLKTLIRPKSLHSLENLLENNNKLGLSQLATLLTIDCDKNFIELEPPSRAFGIIRILRVLFAYYDLTSDFDDGEMTSFFEAIRQCRVSNKQSIRGYAESSKLRPETQSIADEWEDLYEEVSERAIYSSCQRFTAGGYESLASASSRTPAEQRRVFIITESDPEDSDYDDDDSYDDDDEFDISRNSIKEEETVPAVSPEIVSTTVSRTETSTKKKVTIGPTIPFSPVAQSASETPPHIGSQLSSEDSDMLKTKILANQQPRVFRANMIVSPDENSNLPEI